MEDLYKELARLQTMEIVARAKHDAYTSVLNDWCQELEALTKNGMSDPTLITFQEKQIAILKGKIEVIKEILYI